MPDMLSGENPFHTILNQYLHTISIALSQVIEGASGHAALGAVLLSEAAADTLAVTENVVTAMIETVAIVPRVRFIYFLNELNILNSSFL